MTGSAEPSNFHTKERTETGPKDSVDARDSIGVQVGQGNTQIILHLQQADLD